jgi:hypothetical protein
MKIFNDYKPKEVDQGYVLTVANIKENGFELRDKISIVAGGVVSNKMDKQARKIEVALPGAEAGRAGLGIADAVADNADPEGRSKNRRVEFGRIAKEND